MGETGYPCEGYRRTDQGESIVDTEGKHCPSWVPGIILSEEVVSTLP